MFNDQMIGVEQLSTEYTLSSANRSIKRFDLNFGLTVDL